MPADADVLRRDIVAVCQRLYQRGFIAGTEGNVSALEGPDRLWITPSGAPQRLYSLRTCCSLISRDTCCSATDVPQVKRRCTWRCIVDTRPDIGAVVRAPRRWRQPSQLLATASNRLCSLRLWWPWERCQRFRIRCLPRGSLPTTSVRPCAKPRQPCWKIMAVSRWAPRLQAAFNRMEIVERAAQILYLAQLSGRVQPLSPEAVTAPCRRCDRASQCILRHPGSVCSVPGRRRMTCAGVDHEMHRVQHNEASMRQRKAKSVVREYAEAFIFAIVLALVMRQFVDTGLQNSFRIHENDAARG